MSDKWRKNKRDWYHRNKVWLKIKRELGFTTERAQQLAPPIRLPRTRARIKAKASDGFQVVALDAVGPSQQPSDDYR